jgi:phospholipid/cholesterol/gamma-HCH transport system substrate-binding protein
LKITNEIKFGILGIITIVLFIIGMNYMRGSKLFGNTYILYTEYMNTEGLIKGNSIMISGLKVGKVSALTLDLETGTVIGTLEFDEKMDIPVDSRAIIYSTDFLGGKAVRIELGDSLTFIPTNGKIAGSIETSLAGRVEAELAPVKNAVTNLIMQLDSTIKWTNLTLEETGSREQIGAIIRNVNRATLEISNLVGELDVIVKSVQGLAGSAESVVKNVADNNGNVNRLINNLASTSDSLGEIAGNVNKLVNNAEGAVLSLEEIVNKLNSDSSSVGLLLNDRELYDNLNGSVNNVKDLIDAIQKNPQKYLDVDVYVFERKKKAVKEEKE